MREAIARIKSRARQRGQGMTEYIIITALIAIAAIAAVAMFGGTVRNQVGGMASELGGANGTNAITRANAEGTAAATQANAAKHLNDYGNNAAQTR